MNTPTDWVTPLAILGAGLIIGIVLLYFFKSRKSSPQFGGDADLELKDLEAQRDSLIQQLRDLDTDNRLTPQQLVAERTRLERETADVLRAIDGVKPAIVASTEVEPTAATTAPEYAGAPINPAIKGFLWGFGSFAVLFGLGWFVMHSSSDRQQGQGVTGGATMGGAQQQAQAAPVDPMVTQLEQAVQKDPENLNLRNDLAQAYLEHDNLMGVFEQTKFVLEKNPNDSRAMTFQALVRMSMGEGEPAKRMLQQAAKLDPTNLDAWVALAWAYSQENDMKNAEAMIAQAIKVSPENKVRLEEVLQQMKTHANEPPATAQVAAGGELPPGHPAIDGSGGVTPNAGPLPAGMANAQRTIPSDGRSIQVTLNLDPGASAKQGILYVIARNPMGGPPAAVKRLQVTAASFPMTFDFGSADSMMGQPLPDSFKLDARLDTDGDAATKPPTDPHAEQANVTPGAVLKLTLK